MCAGAPAGAFSEPKIATAQIFYVLKIGNVCGRSRRGFFRAQNSDPLIFYVSKIKRMCVGGCRRRPAMAAGGTAVAPAGQMQKIPGTLKTKTARTPTDESVWGTRICLTGKELCSLTYQPPKRSIGSFLFI